jgi:polyadenylation factor subunit 2
MATPVPTLLSERAASISLSNPSLEWKPKVYMQPPQPPPPDEARMHDMEMAVARQLMDGKALKKIRPRRTVDYLGSMGKWALVSGIYTYVMG